MNEQPSLFSTAKVQQWISGSWPYFVWNECSNCGYDKFPSETPPTYCPNCGAILTGGKTRDEINEEFRPKWMEKRS